MGKLSYIFCFSEQTVEVDTDKHPVSLVFQQNSWEISFFCKKEGKKTFPLTKTVPIRASNIWLEGPLERGTHPNFTGWILLKPDDPNAIYIFRDESAETVILPKK